MEIDGIEIIWLGHASFKIKEKCVIYIDPYAGIYDEKADIVLVTHDHFDHLNVDKIKEIKKNDTIIIVPEKGAEKLEGYIRTVRVNDRFETKGVVVEAVPAYNIGKSYHPKGFGVGYIVEVSGVRIYHAGDTDFIPEMKRLKADVALLPVGGTYTMDVREAVEATLAIRPKIVIPMHYGFLPGLEANVKEFEQLVKEKDPNIEVKFK